MANFRPLLRKCRAVCGLFISDAVAEYKDKQFSASLGNLRANTFTSPDLIAEGLRVQNVRVASNQGLTTISAPGAQANVVKAQGTELKGVDAKNLTVSTNGDNTNAKINNIRAANLRTKDANVRNLSANGVVLDNKSGSTDITVSDAAADGVDADGAKIGSIQAGSVNIKIRGNQTDVVSDTLKIARVETDAAVLGSLNIAGVRLKMVAGRIEGTSGDIDAGDVDLKKNGKLENTKLFKPVFILEPSGRYRASMDMSLGGGILGSVRLGAAKASVVADNDKVTLNDLTAEVMDGKINGKAVIAMNQRNPSQVDADFTHLDLSKILALQGGKIVPIAGDASGKANLTFNGTNFKSASGSIVAQFKANAGTQERGLVPINGNVGLQGVNGLFNIDYAKLNTDKSQLSATGRFDLSGSDSNLIVALNSEDLARSNALSKFWIFRPSWKRS